MAGFWADGLIVRKTGSPQAGLRQAKTTPPDLVRGRVVPKRRRSMAQDCCGTIEARSNWHGINSADGEWRPAPRSNNIRRSKALERI
jgi:hypothetical protein